MPFPLDPQVFLFLFGILIVAFTLIIFKMSGPSLVGFVVSVVISLILTALAFYKTDPIMGQNVIFYLVIGLGVIPLLYFASRSIYGLAGSVILGLAIVDFYAYYTRAAYGLYVTLALVAVVALAISLTFFAYKYKVKVQSQAFAGRRLSGRNSPVLPSLPAETDVFAYLDDLSEKYPNPRKRAQYLLSNPDELNMVYDNLDRQTLAEVKRLGG